MARGFGWHTRKTIISRMIFANAPTSSDVNYDIGTVAIHGTDIYQLKSVVAGVATWTNLSEAGDVWVKDEWYAEISSGTTGTITPPTDSTIILDTWPEDIDAVVSTISTGTPPDIEHARESDGTIITTTFNTSGAYTLSGTPSSYPVAIIYAYKIQLKGYDFTKSLNAFEIVDHNHSNNFTENYIDKGSIGASTVTVDVAAAGMQKITATGNLTLAFSDIPASGTAWHVTVEAVNWGAHVPVYPAALDTPGGSAFSLTSSGTDFIEFWGHEGTTTIHGAVASTDSK